MWRTFEIYRCRITFIDDSWSVVTQAIVSVRWRRGVVCSADDSFQDFMNTFAIVSSSGQVLWMFPAVVKTYCTLDVQHFPFDDQKCDVVFISWTFHGHKLNLTYNASENQAIYYTPKNQEWFVDKITVDRQEKVRQHLFRLPLDVIINVNFRGNGNAS